jgi:hypothetical protein
MARLARVGADFLIAAGFVVLAANWVLSDG